MFNALSDSKRFYKQSNVKSLCCAGGLKLHDVSVRTTGSRQARVTRMRGVILERQNYDPAGSYRAASLTSKVFVKQINTDTTCTMITTTLLRLLRCSEGGGDPNQTGEFDPGSE